MIIIIKKKRLAGILAVSAMVALAAAAVFFGMKIIKGSRRSAHRQTAAGD